MKPTVAIYNVETGETTVREMTEEELKQHEADRKKAEAERKALEKEEAIRLAARISALEKLAALGLTEEEIKAITG